MHLHTAAQLVESSFRHPYVLKCYEEGDANSHIQTKHDISHADEVLAVALRLIDLVEEVNPGFINGWTKRVVIPLGAFLHDIGRCINVEEHDEKGAQWAMDFLRHHLKTAEGKTLPADVIRRVARIIAYHRTSRYTKANFTDPALDIVLIADKCVGDEDRVRPGRALILRMLTWIGLPQLGDYMRKGAIHDRVTFAIKKATVQRIDRTLALAIDLDTRVCTIADVYELFAARFHCCVLAATKLGFGFELHFNGIRYAESGTGKWLAI